MNELIETLHLLAERGIHTGDERLDNKCLLAIRQVIDMLEEQGSDDTGRTA